MKLRIRNTCVRLCSFVCLSTLCWLGTAAAESSPSGAQISAIPDSNNQIIKLTDKGIVPDHLSMKLDDSIVFLLNDTTDSLTTLEIAFGEKHMHCQGGNMLAGPDGTSRSVRPFGPRDFASTCFHEPGDYSYTVFGLKPGPTGLKGTIHVE